MAELTGITRAQLNSVLTAQGENSRKSLSKEDSSTLLSLMNSLAQRYPSQDQEQSIGQYFRDFEALALNYSLPKVQRALEALRIRPGQAFFPRPDEVAEEIEHQRETGIHRANRKDGDEFLARQRQWIETYNSPEERAWRKERFGEEYPK